MKMILQLETKIYARNGGSFKSLKSYIVHEESEENY